MKKKTHTKTAVKNEGNPLGLGRKKIPEDQRKQALPIHVEQFKITALGGKEKCKELMIQCINESYKKTQIQDDL